jgi:hypothetical protein
MGLNIGLYKGYQEHPEWDSACCAGDRDFAKLAGELPCEMKRESFDDDPVFRPKDFAVWRAAVAAREWPNPGRFEHMLDLLEHDPDYWIFFGW